MVDIRRLAFPTQRTLQWWERQRGKGLLRFLIVKGALSFGALMYVLGSGIMYLGGWGTLPLKLQSGGGPLVALIVFLLVGAAWGLITWAATEYAYGSHRRKPIRF
jgi:hypothetical protein